MPCAENFFFSESALRQLEERAQIRSRENEHSLQRISALRFHLCCKTLADYSLLGAPAGMDPALAAGDGTAGLEPLHGEGGCHPLRARHRTRTFTFLSFSDSKLSIRFHHIFLKQLHQENDSACGINYACAWPETKGYEVGEGRIVRHTQIKSPWISQMDPISSSYCRKSSCT